MKPVNEINTTLFYKEYDKAIDYIIANLKEYSINKINIYNFCDDSKKLILFRELYSRLYSYKKRGIGYDIEGINKEGKEYLKRFIELKILCDTPPNKSNAEYLLSTNTIKGKTKGIKSKVYKAKELKKLNYGGILSVNAGSKQEPLMIELTYNGDKSNKDRIDICFIGKYISFDSGGLNIKTSNMADMKYDMCGGATAIKIIELVNDLKLKINIVSIICVAENVISENSTRPSDVITSKGIDIEITDTDAEGRVVLSDGILRSNELPCDKVITLATLTGAVSSALGNKTGGLFVTNPMTKINDLELGSSIRELSVECEEEVWQLPITDELRQSNKSKYADIRNYNITGQGGSIMGGAFLEYFFTKYLDFIHLDIAGIASNKDGATGSPLLLLLNIIKEMR